MNTNNNNEFNELTPVWFDYYIQKIYFLKLYKLFCVSISDLCIYIALIRSHLHNIHENFVTQTAFKWYYLAFLPCLCFTINTNFSVFVVPLVPILEPLANSYTGTRRQIWFHHIEDYGEPNSPVYIYIALRLSHLHKNHENLVT